MRTLLPLTAAAFCMAAAISGCSPDRQRFVDNAGNGNTTPTMTTADVSTLISDSGYTRYHLVAPLWQMFEDAEDPFWKFPYGLALEQYDISGAVAATVECDSAKYLSRRKIWRLDGNVVMVNTQSDTFLTQQLFWDQNRRTIYSDSFIHIVRTDHIIEGYGFESDQSMRYYTVNNPTAIIPVEGVRPGRRNAIGDTAVAPAASDSTSVPDPLKPINLRKPSERGNGTATGSTPAQSISAPRLLPGDVSPNAHKPTTRQNLKKSNMK